MDDDRIESFLLRCRAAIRIERSEAQRVFGSEPVNAGNPSGVLHTREIANLQLRSRRTVLTPFHLARRVSTADVTLAGAVQ